ncbi:MAG: TonB-dependent receptor, partial [Bacteroidia bacterium]|nr:TonB-dependent receptor [Bacteroidia bacterium]
LQSNGRSGVLSGMLEGGIGKHAGWGWRAQGTMKRTGDFHTPDYSLTNTGVREVNFSLSTGYHSEHIGVEVFFSHFQSTLAILKGTSISNVDDLLTAMESEPPLQTTDFSYHIARQGRKYRTTFLN